MLKKTSTLFLKIVLILVAVVILFWLLWFPQVEGRNANSDSISLYFNDPFLAYVYASSIPFFIGIYQAFKLLKLIEQNKAFTQASVNTLKKIKHCSIFFAAFIAFAIPYIIFIASDNDSPGVVVIVFVIMVAAIINAAAAGIFQKLFQSAVDLKSENNLTV